MPRRFRKAEDYFQIRRAQQISESHCGPAVIQMLLSNLGVEVTQEAVAEAGAATELIELHGMRVDQLARAVRLLAPDAQFWYKNRSRLEELITLVTDYRYPVGVEWQGLFEDEEEDEDEEGDYGHYSIVTHVDSDKNELVIVDPYKEFVDQDHILTFGNFVRRWWDFNEVTHPKTGKTRLVKDDHMMFIATPKDAIFPKELGMRAA